MLRLAASESTIGQHIIWSLVGVTVMAFQTVGNLADRMKDHLASSPDYDNSQS